MIRNLFFVVTVMRRSDFAEVCVPVEVTDVFIAESLEHRSGGADVTVSFVQLIQSSNWIPIQREDVSDAFLQDRRITHCAFIDLRKERIESAEMFVGDGKSHALEERVSISVHMNLPCPHFG